MSSIEKLVIQGIRSFDYKPGHRGEVVAFQTPLTVIAGSNGSGKTTIIECLKFVTTGILPPGSKVGGAFIHDPGLKGEREVSAAVGLKFRDINGATLTAKRNMQLSIKKGARSQKTMDASLAIDREGQRTSVSTRVAELDLVMPQYLGVSAAVLENVIFCHQDESLWPLAESSVLKKKFDDIFDAAKYTKAVDELKKIRKKHREELGKLELLETSAKKDRDRAKRVQQRCEELRGQVEDLRQKANDLQEKMNHASNVATQAQRDSEGFSMILGRLEGCRVEANGKQNTISNLKLHLKEVSESDEWLENTLSEFEATMARYQEDRDAKRGQWLELKDELKQMQDQLSIKLALKGKFEQEKEEHERLQDRRRQMIRDAATKHSMRGYDELSDDRTIEEFIFKIRKTSKDRFNDLERARKQADSEKQEGQTLINRLTERKIALQDNKSTAKGQIALNDREADEYQKRVDQINVDEGSKAVVESRIENLNSKLQQGQKANASAGRERKLRDVNVELRTLEDDNAALNEQLLQGTKRAGEVARLSHVKQELKERDKSLQTLQQAHGDRIKSLIGVGWTSSSIEQAFETAMNEATKDVLAAERERDGVAREMEHIQFKQKSIRDEITSKKQQAEQCEQAVKKVIDGEIAEYDEVLSSAQLRVDFARDQAKGIGGMADWFTKVLDTAHEKHACRLCERAFKAGNDTAFLKFTTKIEGLIKKATSQEGQSDLNEALADHKNIMEVGVSYENWKTFTTVDIPNLDAENSKLNQQREKLVSQIERHDKKVESQQSAKKELETISKIVSSISKTNSEIQNLTSQVEDLSLKQSQQGNVKTLEDIQEEIGTKTEAIRACKKVISQLTAEETTSKSEQHNMELELRDCRTELGTIISHLDKKSSLAARVEEFKALNQKQWTTIEKADSDIEKIEPEIATAKAKHDDITQRWDSQIQDLTQEAGNLSETVNALNMLNQSIDSYAENDGAKKLSGAVRDIKNLQQNIERTEGSQSQLTVAINKVEEQLRDSDNTRRQYSDNLRYRQESRSLKQLRDEIEELEAKNAHIDRDRLQRESEKWTQEFHNCSGRREGVVGEMKSKDQQIEELLDEYKTDLADASRRYKEAHIKVETTKAAVEDIGRYSVALDRAIMKYHSLKMDQVNGIVEELWRKTYQGTDVDTIYIKSDVEAKSTTKSHNYRVVMVKRDIELDMRGRCSAGQKVLASIIIRLALAECFSVNCGVIALDEPTTNLDEDNIEALARSLHELVKTRQQQKNFQLIIITHDTKFLKQMKCEDFTELYFYVSRNADDCSEIGRQNMQGIL